MNNSPLLQCTDVRKAFPKPDGAELLVLEGMNLELREGQIVGLLGRSGSGKSTLLRLIAGLSEPTAGNLRYLGKPISGPAPGIAMVFQSFALFPWLTVFENVALGLEAQRMSRADLVKTAKMYFSGMQQNDGKGDYPFTDDCNRIENGMQTTNAPLKEGQARPDPATATNYSSAWGCKEQFQSGLLHFVTRIRDRRYVAVDQERGLVFSFIFFDHSAGKTRHFETPNGRAVVAGPTQPWTWELAEMFKVENGKLRQIEAVLDRAPYGMTSGWSSWEDGMTDRARDVATPGNR